MSTHKIVLQECGSHHEEGVLGTAALPGEAVELQADGQWDCTPSAQAAALKGGLVLVKEDVLQGRTVEDAYAIGETAFLFVPSPGDIVQVLVASGEDIDVGDFLVVEGGGSGKFAAAAGTETKFQLQSLEDSGGATAADTLLRARVL